MSIRCSVCCSVCCSVRNTFESISVSSCSMWKVEESGPQWFVNFGYRWDFLKLVGGGGLGKRRRRRKYMIFLKLSNIARISIQIFWSQTFRPNAYPAPTFLRLFRAFASLFPKRRALVFGQQRPPLKQTMTGCLLLQWMTTSLNK